MQARTQKLAEKLLRWDLSLSTPAEKKPRVCAVSYLNTVPLVWGMLHGEQRGLFELSFAIPSVCAGRLEDGSADIGIVPVVELPRLGLEPIPGTGIACRGPVRSILLVSRKPLRQVRTLAADEGSRTSVALARILLAEVHGATPEVRSMAPVLGSMLAAADAAVLIGDAALRVDIDTSPFEVWDLGGAWVELTGKPMVFAVWAGRSAAARSLEGAFTASCRFGLERLEQIIALESARRRLPPELVRAYLTRHIAFELGDNEYEGLELFLERAARLEAVPAGVRHQ
jgi:predicted solute-binding protein